MTFERSLEPWIIFSNFLRKIWVQRGLIRTFVVRDLRARYIGSFMGIFWSVIHPLVLLASYTFVFSLVFGQRAPADSGTGSFALFLFCSILPWLLFQDTVQRSSTVIVDNTNLVCKTLFPTEILPLTVLMSATVNHLVGCAILLATILVTIGHPSLYLALLPVYLLCLMLFTLGVAWLVSSLNVFVRDVSQVLSVVLIFWFWFTPIFFTAERLPERLRFLVEWNPLAYVVAGYRDCLLRRQAPDLGGLALLAAVSTAVFIAGGTFFRKTKREFVDVL
jgi:ABC-type polysaccharide/polyol phosphate export permease